jgi:O-antigen/teichoic acid export membrane protein
VSTAIARLSTDNKESRAREGMRSGAVTSELKKLLQHSSHYLSGILISLAVGFISFPIFTRAFSVSEYGTIDLIAKALLLVTALSKMGLQQSALRFYDGSAFSSDQASARRYYSTMLGGVVLTAAFATALFLGAVSLAPKSLINSSLKALLFLVSSLIAARALTALLWVFLRVQEKTKLYSAFTVATKVGTLAAICLFMPWLGRTIRAFYSGTILAEVAVVVILCVILFQQGLVKLESFDITLFRSGLAFGLPLIFYEIASITLDAADRILVRHYLGADALGRYSIAYGMSDYLNNLLILPINLALAPIYFRLWASEGQQKTSEFLSRSLDLFFMVSIGIFVLAATTSRSAVLLLASSKYLGAEVLIPTIVAGLLVYTSHAFFSAGLMIHKNTRVMARILAYSALLNIGLNCILLRRMGLQAAALATLLSYLFCVLLLGRASRKVLPLRIDLNAIGKYALAAASAWYAGSRVEVESVVGSLAVRFAITLAVYGGLLYLMDSRVRALPGQLFTLGRQPVDLKKKEFVAMSESEL